jgi:Zn-dependent alcohol dehydrogenase
MTLSRLRASALLASLANIHVRTLAEIDRVGPLATGFETDFGAITHRAELTRGASVAALVEYAVNTRVAICIRHRLPVPPPPNEASRA